MNYRFSTTPDLLHRGKLLYNFAWYEWRQGRYDAAYIVASEAEKIHQTELGAKNPMTIDSLVLSAVVLRYQGKYEAAEEMNRRALEGREATLGKDHPDTLTSVYCLASLYHCQREYVKASSLYQRACEGYEIALGTYHPTTVACRSHYASMLKNEIK
jgi:ATP/maltotriose-dependent transcriptional regulator MalT